MQSPQQQYREPSLFADPRCLEQSVTTFLLRSNCSAGLQMANFVTAAAIDHAEQMLLSLFLQASPYRPGQAVVSIISNSKHLIAYRNSILTNSRRAVRPADPLGNSSSIKDSRTPLYNTNSSACSKRTPADTRQTVLNQPHRPHHDNRNRYRSSQQGQQASGSM